jgi:uncharacterized damage-inducible protein DinB
MPDLDEIFVDFSADKLKQLSSRIEDCLGKLTDAQIWMRGSENENAVGNLVLHLCGNLSQWIVCGVGGAADTRNRDAEFAARGHQSREALIQLLFPTVEAAVAVLRSLNADRLAEITTVQGYRLTVLEAVYHVVEHFAGHTGQIIFATKLLTQGDLGYYRHLSSNAPAPRADEQP